MVVLPVRNGGRRSVESEMGVNPIYQHALYKRRLDMHVHSSNTYL